MTVLTQTYARTRGATRYRSFIHHGLIHYHTHTHPFNGPLSRTTWVSRYQKGKKTIWMLLKQETVSGSGISWATCKSAPRSRQITCRPTNSVKALKAMLMAGLTMVIIFVEEVGRAMGAGTVEVTCGLAWRGRV